MIDFSLWNLTIPVGAKLITTSVLNAGYTDEFFIRNDDDTVTFRAPSSGEGIQSTQNSTYPRSELRETLADGSIKQANWIPSSNPVHVLEATLKVDTLPLSGKAIIGQFHGDSDHPPLKIQITNNVIYAQLRRQLEGIEDKPKLLTGYVLGTYFTYKVEMFATGCVKFYINGSQIINATLPEQGYAFDMASYEGDTWYAKAGVYSQEKVGGVGEGQVTFSSLRMFHGTGIGDLSSKVDSIVSAFDSGHITSSEALAAIQIEKLKADNNFVKSVERTAFYDHVVEARIYIRSI